LAMGMWDDVVKANEVAMSVVNTQRAAAGRPPRYCGHYTYWLEYGYVQQGRIADARKILDSCRVEAEHQAARVSEHPSGDPYLSSISAYASMRANFLVDTELWQDSAAAWNISAAQTATFPPIQIDIDYIAGLAAYKSGHPDAARESLTHLESDLRQYTAWS